MKMCIGKRASLTTSVSMPLAARCTSSLAVGSKSCREEDRPARHKSYMSMYK